MNNLKIKNISLLFVILHYYPISKVIKVLNQITIQQLIRLQSWGYVLITIIDSNTIYNY